MLAGMLQSEELVDKRFYALAAAYGSPLALMFDYTWWVLL